MVVLEEHADLRLGFRDRAEHLPRRLDEDLVFDFDVGLVDHIGVAVEHDDGAQAAHVRLEIEEVVELGPVLVENRLGARELDRHRNGVGAHQPVLVAHIGLRNDQRGLDHALGLRRDQPVETAIDRDARYHGHQDRRHRGDDRKQGDDANMQPRAGAAAPARLDHAPDFPADDSEQQPAGHGIADQDGLDRLVGRGDRREVGEYQEGRERR